MYKRFGFEGESNASARIINLSFSDNSAVWLLLLLGVLFSNTDILRV